MAPSEERRAGVLLRAETQSFFPPPPADLLTLFQSLENLADHYSAKVAELLADIEELKRSVEETAKFLEAAMHARRNQLLKMEVGLEVTAVVFGSGSMISGIFGMNLVSGLENSGSAFGLTLVVMAILGVTIMILAWAYFRNNEKNKVYKRLCEKFGSHLQQYSAFSLCAAVPGDWGGKAVGIKKPKPKLPARELKRRSPGPAGAETSTSISSASRGGPRSVSVSPSAARGRWAPSSPANHIAGESHWRIGAAFGGRGRHSKGAAFGGDLRSGGGETSPMGWGGGEYDAV